VVEAEVDDRRSIKFGLAGRAAAATGAAAKGLMENVDEHWLTLRINDRDVQSSLVPNGASVGKNFSRSSCRGGSCLGTRARHGFVVAKFEKIHGWCRNWLRCLARSLGLHC
jgi:hypothetical protein